MAEMCLELREEIVGAHGAYVRCATRNGANFILPGLYDRLARLLGHNMANGIVRDHPPPRDRDGESYLSARLWCGVLLPQQRSPRCN